MSCDDVPVRVRTLPQEGPQHRRATVSSVASARVWPRVVLGLGAALWSVLLGLAILVCVVLSFWVSADHHTGSVQPALRFALQSWLVAHHDGLALSHGRFDLTPLGLSIGLGAILVRAGRWTARHSAATTTSGCLGVAATLALPYGVTAALLTAAATSGPVRADPLAALAGGLVLAGGAAFLGALREARAADRLRAAVPAEARRVARAVVRALVVLAVGALVLIGAAVLLRLPHVAATPTALDGGAAADVALVLLCLAYLPNAAVWALAYSAGPGFAAGLGTVVSPAAAQVGTLPPIPLLAAIPTSTSALGWVTLVVPLAAGIAAGLTVAEPGIGRRRCAVRIGAVAGAVAAVGVAAAWLSGGSLGPGAMVSFGPPPAWTGLAVGGLVAVGASATAGVRLRGLPLWWPRPSLRRA